MWQPWTGPGLESLKLVEDADGVRVDSVAIGMDDGRPFAIRYAIRCDAAWHVRDVEIAEPRGRSTTLALASNGMGRWTDGSGDHVPALDGCLDVDLSATPFTNTLPIRRLALAPGWATEITVVYVDVPVLRIGVSRQRYRCLTWGPRAAVIVTKTPPAISRPTSPWMPTAWSWSIRRSPGRCGRAEPSRRPAEENTMKVETKLTELVLTSVRSGAAITASPSTAVSEAR